MDYKKLRGRIVSEYGSVKAFAEDNGYNLSTIYQKLNGHTDFTVAEINDLCKLLRIKGGEIGSFFFTKSSENRTK